MTISFYFSASSSYTSYQAKGRGEKLWNEKIKINEHSKAERSVNKYVRFIKIDKMLQPKRVHRSRADLWRVNSISLVFIEQ